MLAGHLKKRSMTRKKVSAFGGANARFGKVRIRSENETECNRGRIKHDSILGGPHGTEVAFCASHPAAPGLILGVPEFSMLLRFIDSALLREWTVQKA